MKKFAAIAASVAAVSAPTVSAEAETVILGEGLLQPKGTTASFFRGELCRENDCRSVGNYPVSVSSQRQLFDNAVQESTAPMSVVGYSLSAAAVSDLVEQWMDHPETAPKVDDVRVMTLGSPDNEFGGSSRRNNAGSAREPDPYPHLEVSAQYDLVSDQPTRWGWYSMINLSLSQHFSYSRIDLNDPANLVYQDGNTTHMLVEAEVLPMLAWMDWFIDDETMERLDAIYRPRVEKDYDRPDFQPQGEGADWYSPTDEGIEDGIEETTTAAALEIEDDTTDLRDDDVSVLRGEDIHGDPDHEGTSDVDSDESGVSPETREASDNDMDRRSADPSDVGE